MSHLSPDCHGHEHCLDDWSKRLTTHEPARSLPTQYFEFLSDEDKGLLHITSRVCPDICDPRRCPNPEPGVDTHHVRLMVEDDLIRILRACFTDCGCPEVQYTVPKDLSTCILSGWNVWLGELEKWNNLLATSPSSRSPSPDPEVPDLLDYIQSQNAAKSLNEDLVTRNLAQDCPSGRKRPAEDVSEYEEDSSDEESSSPRPAVRMRTGPCADIVRKMEARKRARFSS
ncbi:hypothetical protein V5O48_013463 [Marasmius crinis-equi]|uniref:Uncharacterized protein n=1 Tax=Marasmius crinis-equi TaxID=585013 RepID=A0ABR3F005_9AGAR